jgi:hypothetical protein
VLDELLTLDELLALTELEVGPAEPVALRVPGSWLEPPHPARPRATATPRAGTAAGRRRRRMCAGLTTVAQHTQPK